MDVIKKSEKVKTFALFFVKNFTRIVKIFDLLLMIFENLKLKNSKNYRKFVKVILVYLMLHFVTNKILERC